jgi:hypothetical protein
VTRRHTTCMSGSVDGLDAEDTRPRSCKPAIYRRRSASTFTTVGQQLDRRAGLEIVDLFCGLLNSPAGQFDHQVRNARARQHQDDTSDRVGGRVLPWLARKPSPARVIGSTCPRAAAGGSRAYYVTVTNLTCRSPDTNLGTRPARTWAHTCCTGTRRRITDKPGETLKMPVVSQALRYVQLSGPRWPYGSPTKRR